MIGIVIAVAAASVLNYFIPTLYPWGDEEARPSHFVAESDYSNRARPATARISASLRLGASHF